MNKAYLLIGGNIGDRNYYLQCAQSLIKLEVGDIIQTSSVYETAAWGKEDQTSFLNQVIVIVTNLKARVLLDHLLAIEERLGRKRTIKFGPRTIDIDILLFNNENIDVPGLLIPHPALPARRFALVPLEELGPDLVHPVLKKSIKQLLAECVDTLEVQRWQLAK